MKNVILVLILAILSVDVQAQWSTNASGVAFRTGSVVVGGSSINGSYGSETVFQVQGSSGSVFGMRTGSAALDMYLGSSWLTLNAVNAPMYLSTNYSTRIAILGNGNVGIGTTTPGSFRLAVEGKIGAREVNVTNANPWPDFVFEKNYTLPSLSFIEQYIQANKHLPEIPSASEVKTNGVDLGEMNALLLKKIEEMTLYLIEQDKMLKAQGNRLLTLEKEMKALKQ